MGVSWYVLSCSAHHDSEQSRLTHTYDALHIAYASFKAIESPSPYDDKQWLTYWTVIGFVQLIEYFSDILLYWFPFYYLFKTLFVLYLALPQFRVSGTWQYNVKPGA